MIVLISGTTHTGKTKLAQELMEKYKIPYYSIDHIKMGLIRSHQTTLTPNNDEKLTHYLWPILVEMMKTAIENKQHFILEGCYIPFDYSSYFSHDELKQIQYYCLIMSKEYILNHVDEILKFENCIEQRLPNSLNIQQLILENENNLKSCQKYQLPYIYIDKKYEIKISLSI